MLKNRTFNIAIVGDSKAVGIEPAESFDATVSYSGRKVAKNID